MLLLANVLFVVVAGEKMVSNWCVYVCVSVCLCESVGRG